MLRAISSTRATAIRKFPATNIPPPLSSRTELARTRGRGRDGALDGLGETGAVELAEAGERRTARRAHHLAELLRAHSALEHHRGGPLQRAKDQSIGDVVREPLADARRDQRLGKTVDVGRAAAGEPGHRVE